MYRHEVSSVRSVDQASADSGQPDSPLTTAACRFASRYIQHPETTSFSSTLPAYRRCMYIWVSLSATHYDFAEIVHAWTAKPAMW